MRLLSPTVQFQLPAVRPSTPPKALCVAARHGVRFALNPWSLKFVLPQVRYVRNTSRNPGATWCSLAETLLSPCNLHSFQWIQTEQHLECFAHASTSPFELLPLQELQLLPLGSRWPQLAVRPSANLLERYDHLRLRIRYQTTTATFVHLPLVPKGLRPHQPNHVMANTKC